MIVSTTTPIDTSLSNLSIRSALVHREFADWGAWWAHVDDADLTAAGLALDEAMRVFRVRVASIRAGRELEGQDHA